MSPLWPISLCKVIGDGRRLFRPLFYTINIPGRKRKRSAAIPCQTIIQTIQKGKPGGLAFFGLMPLRLHYKAVSAQKKEHGIPCSFSLVRLMRHLICENASCRASTTMPHAPVFAVTSHSSGMPSTAVGRPFSSQGTVHELISSTETLHRLG